ncbi:MAG: LysR family transcriptional regulator [Solirubrobacterales bacterium]|nr:LysR family transcriptional regulator [Solirubrobacterales bacterium]
MDVQTRRLRYFVVLAEELHFSRTAARLHIAQQALSKQIRDLEEAVGAQLLRRSTRKVELTPAGAAFLGAAHATLAAFDDGVEAARRLARGEAGTLRLGYVVGGALELTRPILEEFARRHPLVELEMREYGHHDRSAGLAGRSADVAFLRPPISAAGVALETLFVEPLVVALPPGHRLAGRAGVSVRELVEEAIAVGESEDVAAERFWTLDAYRDPGAPRRILHARSVTEELSLVSAGVACAITSAALARYTPQPSVRYVPIEDGPGTELALAWRKDAPGPLVERFREAARAVRERETELVHAIEHPDLS